MLALRASLGANRYLALDGKPATIIIHHRAIVQGLDELVKTFAPHIGARHANTGASCAPSLQVFPPNTACSF